MRPARRFPFGRYRVLARQLAALRDPASALRALRRALSTRGLPSRERRTPEDSIRLAVIHTLREVEHLIDQLRRRLDAGDRCRLVVTEKGGRLGLVILHLEIVSVPTETPP